MANRPYSGLFNSPTNIKSGVVTQTIQTNKPVAVCSLRLPFPCSRCVSIYPCNQGLLVRFDLCSSDVRAPASKNRPHSRILFSNFFLFSLPVPEPWDRPEITANGKHSIKKYTSFVHISKRPSCVTHWRQGNNVSEPR